MDLTVLILLLIPLFTFFLRETAGKAHQCKMLFMCPSFCMRVKNGCYVCECDSLHGALQKASNELRMLSGQKLTQTGSQMIARPFAASSGGQVQEYRYMYMNIPFYQQTYGQGGGQSWTLTGHAPGGSISYQHNYFMPGMGCGHIASGCPSVCWQTDIFTGCITCNCGTTKLPDAKLDLPAISEIQVASTAQSLPSQHPSSTHLPVYLGRTPSTPTTLKTPTLPPFMISHTSPSRQPVTQAITSADLRINVNASSLATETSQTQKQGAATTESMINKLNKPIAKQYNNVSSPTPAVTTNAPSSTSQIDTNPQGQQTTMIPLQNKGLNAHVISDISKPTWRETGDIHSNIASTDHDIPLKQPPFLVLDQIEASEASQKNYNSSQYAEKHLTRTGTFSDDAHNSNPSHIPISNDGQPFDQSSELFGLPGLNIPAEDDKKTNAFNDSDPSPNHTFQNNKKPKFKQSFDGLLVRPDSSERLNETNNNVFGLYGNVKSGSDGTEASF